MKYYLLNDNRRLYSIHNIIRKNTIQKKKANKDIFRPKKKKKPKTEGICHQ